MIEIKIDTKYLYVLKDNEHLAYFEHFEIRKEKRNVIKLATEDKEGEKFLETYINTIMGANVYWFSKKKLRYKVMFVKEKNGAFSYMIMIVPKLLSNPQE